MTVVLRGAPRCRAGIKRNVSIPIQIRDSIRKWARGCEDLLVQVGPGDGTMVMQVYPAVRTLARTLTDAQKRSVRDFVTALNDRLQRDPELTRFNPLVGQVGLKITFTL